MKTIRVTADDFFEKENYQAALQVYLDILRQEPDDGKSHQRCAQCYYRLKSYDSAISECLRAIELDQTLAIPHVTLAYIYFDQRKYDHGFSEAETAYNLSPDVLEVINCYGALLAVKGRFKEGVLVLQRALEIDATFVGAHYNLALAYEKIGNYKKSLEEMKTVFKYKPSLRHGWQLFVMYEKRYAVVFTIAIMTALLCTIFLRIRILLLLPSIFALQLWVSGYQLVRRGKKKMLLLLYWALAYSL